MTTKIEPISILLISKNPFIYEATRSTLAKVEFLRLFVKEITPVNYQAVLAETKPDVILLDFEFLNQSFELLEQIISGYPESMVIVVLSESDMIHSDRVILSGARAFIQYPFQADNLIVTIKRVMDLMVRDQDYLIRTPAIETEIKPRNTFIVFSPKGGVGTTTTAVNLAISLQKSLNEDVLLIDGKHQFGHVALYLNLRTGNSITDLLTYAGMLDQRLIRQVVIKHISGIHVLPSPNSIFEAQGIKPENLFPVIQSLQQVFSNIIIDGGNNLNENTVTYMDSSDKILLVLNPDLASMRDVKQFIEVAATLSYPKDKTLLILNQTGRKADVKREEIENILKMKIFGKIPSDENVALSSLNEGVPILIRSPRHPISKSFADITTELVKIIQTSRTEFLEKTKSEETEIK
jgi:pilus assembly protein CpaE